MADHLDTQWETKALKEDGSFVGHASVYNNVDLGGDIVAPGAFKEIVKNRAGKSVVLWQHRTDQPIAVADLTPDGKGLKVEGQLILDDPLAKTVYAHLKAGSVSGMSFGYNVLDYSLDNKTGVRTLNALKVWEASIVTVGMNPKAGVEKVKSANLTTVREFEEFLRDVGGFSVTQAKALASGGWGALRANRDGDQATESDAQTLAMLGTLFSLSR